jgi:replication factor A1
MSAPEEFDNEIRAVKEAVPDADENAIADEFRRYRDEFLIPPKEALRSVLKKFQTEAGMEVTAPKSSGGRTRSPAKSVDRFSDLKADDSNVTIEVKIVTYTPRIQMVRGEERQIAFGWIEDNPWEDGGIQTRWDFKDWGNHAESLAPGSIVRLEGVSVNEWNNKRSININQSSRIAVLRAGDRAVVLAPSEPIPIDRVLDMDGFATVVGRVIMTRQQSITRKDGVNVDMVKGRLADETGSIGFACWGDFEHPAGTLLKIENVAIRRYRDTPELSIGDRTKVELFHDGGFASLEELEVTSMSKIESLRDGAVGVSIIVQLSSWDSRTFTNQEGEEKTVWGGDVVDPTGSCRLTAWTELSIDTGSLPMALQLENVRVRGWQGSPDLVVDRDEQVKVLDNLPWEEIDPSNHSVSVTFSELMSGGSRNGVASEATVIAVQSGSGIIHRCPDCRKAMRDGACRDHGPQSGVEDLRLRLILDDGIQNGALILSREPSETLLGCTMEDVSKEFKDDGGESFVVNLRSKLIGRRWQFNGRAIIDGQGALIMANTFKESEETAADAAQIVREKWEVFV